MVTVVDPRLESDTVVKLPLPAELTDILAVCPVALLAPDKL
jgi:hypothetical protein